MRRRGHRLSPIPAFDFLFMLAVLTLAIMTEFAVTVRRMSPMVDHVNDHAARLHSTVDAVARLNQGRFRNPAEIKQLDRAIPERVPGELGLLSRLLATSAASTANYAVMQRLAPAEEVVWRGQLTVVAQAGIDFWTRLTRELCVPRSEIPAAPALPADADRIALARYLEAVHQFGQRIWALYVKCLEPRKIVIDEDLLHFKVDKADAFETDPGPTFVTIMKYVDATLRTHNQVYVVGHTDEQAGNRYNDYLSYRRALFVADRIRLHLTHRGLVEGRDFALYPLGMGEYQAVPREPGERDESFWKRCRRIEISFRSLGGAPDARGGT